MILKKPCETPSRLNLAHLHAQGLEASYLFNGQGNKVFDYTCNQNELSVVNASYTADGLQIDANGEYANIDPINYDFKSDEGTIIFYFKSLSAFADGVDRTYFNQTGTNRIFIRKFSSNVLRFYIFDGATRYIDINNIDNYNTEFNQIAFVWNRTTDVFNSKKMAIAVNGEFIVPSGSSAATTINNVTFETNMCIGNPSPSTSTSPINGIVKHLNIHNYSLLENTLKSMYEDQYAMYDVYSNMMFSFFFSVSVPLVITTQPENTTVAKETDASFSVEATGSGTLTYQWYRNSELQAGETSSTYSFTTALSNNNDSIYCIVLDDNSSLQSDTVFLTVVSCVMNTSADALEEKDYPVPQKIEYKEAHEK